MRMDVSKLLTASALVLLAPFATGFVAPKTTPSFSKSLSVTVGQKVIRPILVPSGPHTFSALKGNGHVAVETDAITGAVRLISGGQLTSQASLRDVTTTSDFVAVAMDYVRDHADVFGVTPDDLVLNKPAVLIDKDVQFLKFNVMRAGIVIADAHIDFRFKQGKLLQVANTSYAEASFDGSQKLVGADFEPTVTRAVNAEKVTLKGEKLRVVADKHGYHLVSVAEYAAKTGNTTMLVQVDQATGKVFEVAPTRFDLQGSASGQVFPRWYNEAVTVVPYYDVNLSFANGSVTTGMDGTFADAPDTAQPALNGFKGSRVRVLASTGTAPNVTGARVRENWVVRFEKSATEAPYMDKSMAHSMAFHNVNDEIMHAKRFISTPWIDSLLTVNVNLADTCNAYWDGSTVNLFSAGDGCANTGNISDVVFHEWGHGLDDNTGGIEDGAYSEGFGDIMSLAMTHSHLLGVGFLYPSFDPVRDLAPNKVYPADAGEVHDEGQIIGSTFWDLFDYLRQDQGETVAGDLISNYALKTIFTASKYTDVYNAVLVVDDNNGDLSDQTPNYCTINKAFAEHGLATIDVACNLAGIDSLPVDDSAGNNNGIIEPGETIQLTPMARNAGATALNGLVGTLSVGDVAGINVTQGQLTWDSIPARGARSSNAPAVIEVSPTAACGTKFTASVRLAADTRSATQTKDFFIGRLTGTSESFTATGLPMPVTDNHTTEVNLPVNTSQWSAGTLIQAAHLRFDVTHPYVGDLTISLVSPAGVTKQIYRGSGSGDDVHFDADVSAAVAGLPGLGTWKLAVNDSASQDEGSVDAATLSLTPAVYVCQ